MDYRNPKLLENGWIDCEIDHPEYGWIPFTCDPNDKGTFFDAGKLFEEMKPHAAPYVPPSQDEIDALTGDNVRSKRDMLLSTEVDPIVMNPLRWGEMTDGQKQALSDYRKALLDLPQQAGFPHDVIWPIKP